jgi:hypothetical protein
MNKFDDIQAMLGLTDKEKGQVLSINMNNDASRLYKEVWIGLGGTHSAVCHGSKPWKNIWLTRPKKPKKWK